MKPKNYIFHNYCRRMYASVSSTWGLKFTWMGIVVSRYIWLYYLSWSVLSHVLSEEQSKDSSDGASDDGRLTIVQCHHYHRPPLSDLHWSSIGILPLLQYHQQTCILIIAITNQHHVLSTTAQPEPHHTPHTFHVPGQSYRTHTSSQGHGSRTPQGLARIWVSILWHPSEYKSFRYMFHSTTICSPKCLLICLCLSLYKYSSLLYVFRQFKYQLSNLLLLTCSHPP